MNFFRTLQNMAEDERAASVLERQLLILRANHVQFLDVPGEWLFTGGVNDVFVYVDNSFMRYPSLQHVKSLFTNHQQVIPLLVGTINVQQPLWAYILWRRDGTFCITLYDFVVGVLNAPSTVFFLEALRHKIVYMDAYDWKHMASMIMMEYAYRLSMSELKSANCEPILVGSIDITHIHSVCKPRRVDVDQIQFMELEDSLQTITVKETRPADLQNYYVPSAAVELDDDFFPSALFTPGGMISGLSTPFSSDLALQPPLPSFDLPPSPPFELPQMASGLPQMASGLPPLASGLPPLASGLPPLASGLPPLASGLPPQPQISDKQLLQQNEVEYPLIVDMYGREVVEMGSGDNVAHLLSTESNAELEQALNDLQKTRAIRRLDRRVERPAYYRLRKEATYFKTIPVVG